MNSICKINSNIKNHKFINIVKDFLLSEIFNKIKLIWVQVKTKTKIHLKKIWTYKVIIIFLTPLFNLKSLLVISCCRVIIICSKIALVKKKKNKLFI